MHGPDLALRNCIESIAWTQTDAETVELGIYFFQSGEAEQSSHTQNLTQVKVTLGEDSTLHAKG